MNIKVQIKPQERIGVALKDVIKVNTATGTTNITKNGFYDVGEYKYADVFVNEQNLQEKDVLITENGTYEVLPDDSYLLTRVEVDVNVPVPEGYIIPEGVLDISENGEHNVREYEKVKVDVPIPDGYIIPEGILDISENGKHDVNDYKEVDVNVPVPDGYIIPEGTLEIDTNGEHDVNNYKNVNVNVPIPDGYIIPEGTINIDNVGIYNVTDYAEANFSVPTEVKEFIPTKEQQEYNPTDAYITSVKVQPIPDEYIVPEGKVNISNTEEIDVTQYAKAQIIDDNLKAENIAEGVEVLGIVGEFKGGLTPEGTLDITENGEYDVTIYEKANVNVSNQDYLDFLNGTFGDTYYAPEGALGIKGYSFYNNQNIIGLVCSSTVKTLGTWCCRDAKKLKNVSLNDGLETIGQYSFYGCIALEEVVIPETVRSIENYVFNGCTNLNKVNVPNGVKIIMNYCFANCTNLLTLTLPASVTQINNYALTYGSNGNATLIMKATTPPIITSLAIGSGIGSITVPQGSLEAYKSATNWSAKADIIEEE